jgi:hypothetical protein
MITFGFFNFYQGSKVVHVAFLDFSPAVIKSFWIQLVSSLYV